MSGTSTARSLPPWRTRERTDVGVATVTCGPGVTQLITALPAAVRARLPLVVFAGEAPLKSGLAQPGNRPGTAHRRDRAPRITSLHMPERMPVAGTRRVPAGASRTSPRGDRHSVRSAGPALGRACGFCPRPRASCCRGLRRFRRIPTTWLAPRNWSPAPSGSSCSPAWVRSKPGRAAACRALAAEDRWTAVDDASRARAVPRRSLLHRHLGQLHARGRPRVPGAGRLRRRGRLFARLPRGRRRPALAEGEDAADRHRPCRGQPGPGGGASSPAGRRAPGRRGVDGSAADPQRRAGEAMRWLRASAIRSPTATYSRSSRGCSTRATWSRRWKRPCRTTGRW